MHSSDQIPEQVDMLRKFNWGGIHLCLGENLKKYFMEEGVFVLGLEGERSFLRAGMEKWKGIMGYQGMENCCMEEGWDFSWVSL